MLAGQAHADRQSWTPRTGSMQARCLVTGSGSIVQDSRAARTPIWVERRQTEQPGTQGTKIPCFRAPDQESHLPFWIQLIAAGNRYSLRQLRTVHTWTEQGEGRTAMFSLSSASLINGVLSGFLQIQNAVSMSNPEVEECR